MLVSEESYTDEDGVTVTRRSYIKDSGISPYTESVSQGEADIKEEATYSSSGYEWVTLWVNGHFKWDSEANTSTVKLLDYGYTKHNTQATVIENKTPTYGSNQGGALGGKKYSYIEKKITLQSNVQIGISDGKKEFRLWVDVNVNGVKTVKT